MAKLFITLGIPGSGKSTWLSTFLSHAEIVSSDAIREEFTGDASDQTQNAKIFDEFHYRIDTGLRYGHDVAADSTALDKAARDRLLEIAAKHEAEAHLIVFDNVVQAMSRNTKRTRVVPLSAMKRMLDKYEFYKLNESDNALRYSSVTEIRSLN